MILVDSSLWIAQLRSTAESPGPLTELRTRRVDEFVTTEVVLMEVLAGARDYDVVSSRLAALPVRHLMPATDYAAATLLFRSARRLGQTVRSLNDCVIAAVALRCGDEVAHRDADFEALAQVSDLRTIDLR